MKELPKISPGQRRSHEYSAPRSSVIIRLVRAV